MQRIINQTEEYVKSKLKGESSGHDWWHVYRVWKTAINIAKKEEANLYIVELASLLHDIADWKFHSGDDSVGPTKAREWLEEQKVNENIIYHVSDIIQNISFKGAGVLPKIKTLEGKIVQDADRLDAIGAIGIARTFAYGGHSGREMYDPNIKPEKHDSFDQYKNSKGSTINHFYEKLLLLKDLMNTETGKAMALERHNFMELYLEQFFIEWEGKK